MPSQQSEYKSTANRPQRIQPPVSRAASPSAVVAPPPYRGQMQAPPSSTLTQAAPSLKNSSSKWFKRKTQAEGLNPSAFHIPGSRRTLFFIVIAFLITFGLVAASAVSKVNNAAVKTRADIVSQLAQDDARAISERINSQIKWTDGALSVRGSSSQIVQFATRGPNVTGVAMLDASGSIIASYPQAAKALSSISLSNFPKSGINLTSLVSQGGVANPVIARKISDIYLITMMSPGSLLGAGSEQSQQAIVSPGGRVIDGHGTVAVDGILSAFNISPEQLSRITSKAEGVNISPVGKTKSNLFLTTTRIPNTDLTVMSHTVSPSVQLPSSLPYFGLLFLCTAALIGGLVRIAMRQIETITETHDKSAVSQERYRVAVEGGRGGVWEIDLKNNSVYMNSSLSKLLGLEQRDQTITLPQFLGLFHAADRERLLATARRAHIQGDLDIEMRVAHLPLFLQCRGNSSERNQNDGSTVIVGVAMDITEQRGAQERLQAAEARLYDALNAMSDSFVIWDARGRLVLWNGKFNEFFNFTPGQLQTGLEQDIVEQIANKSIEEFFEPEDTDEHVEIKLKDGRWVRYSEATTADGGKVSIGTDITEIRLRENELRENDIALRNTVDVLRKSQSRIMELADNYEQEKIRAEEANQSKSDFLANMSHELRTPLNAINGFSDIMKKEMFGPLGDPRYKEYVSDILFSGQHLLSLINDILDMSKIEAGKMTLNTDMLQINEMISQVVRIVRGRAEEGRLKLIYEGEDFEEVEADQRAVKQVLLNLITNAIKFTPEGGTVRILAERKQAGIIIKVIDSGIGISKENIERLAKPFEQIDTEHSKQQEGTGLGLALSKSLIELHGGNFLMESEPGVGTTVSFTLPNRPPVQEEVETDSEVGNEINRLAQDIADILVQSEDETSPPHAGQYAPIQGQPAQHIANPQQAAPQHQAAPQQSVTASSPYPAPPVSNSAA